MSVFARLTTGSASPHLEPGIQTIQNSNNNIPNSNSNRNSNNNIPTTTTTTNNNNNSKLPPSTNEDPRRSEFESRRILNVKGGLS